MSNHIDPKRYEQFGWRATVAAVRASKCSLNASASVALCAKLLERADWRAFLWIQRNVECPVKQADELRHLNRITQHNQRPLLGRRGWLFAREGAQRGTVAKGKTTDYYIERHRLSRLPRRDRVRYYAVINSHRIKPYQPRWTGQMVDLTGGRYDEATVVYAGNLAKCNPWYDEVDQGYRERGHDEAAANDW